MPLTIIQLLAKAQEIYDEHGIEENTQVRVGQMLKDIIEYLQANPGGGGGGIESVTGATVNNTDPLNPIVGLSRFGVAGEDVTAAANRTFHLGGFTFNMDDALSMVLSVFNIALGGVGTSLSLIANDTKISQSDNAFSLIHKFAKPSDRQGSFFLPVSVSDKVADSTGNIDLGLFKLPPEIVNDVDFSILTNAVKLNAPLTADRILTLPAVNADNHGIVMVIANHNPVENEFHWSFSGGVYNPDISYATTQLKNACIYIIMGMNLYGWMILSVADTSSITDFFKVNNTTREISLQSADLLGGVAGFSAQADLGSGSPYCQTSLFATDGLTGLAGIGVDGVASEINMTGKVKGDVNPADNYANDGLAAATVAIGQKYHDNGIVRLRLV